MVQVTFAGAGTAVRGNTLHFCIADEIAFWNPTFWLKLYSPMLDDTGGKAFITSTMNGYNFYYNMIHAYRKLEQEMPNSYAELEYDVHTADHYDQKWIKVREAEYKMSGKHYLWRQEYLNDPAAASSGAAPFADVYDHKQLVTLPELAMINKYSYINVNIDIGAPGHMPGWAWVRDFNGTYIMKDYFEDIPDLEGLPAYLLNRYPQHARINLYVPHDIHHTSIDLGESRWDRLIKNIRAEGAQYKIYPKDIAKPKERAVLVSRGIQLLRRTIFDTEKTTKGVQRLLSVRFKQETGPDKAIQYGKFVRNGSEHTADAFCYIAASGEQYKSELAQIRAFDEPLSREFGYEGTKPNKY